ncbi:MAG: polyamine aminopropyltransferase [Dehalococcoidia bacterium]|nr:polyamine aminopropyltransferase [Dehalococcoidia bacterium]
MKDSDPDNKQTWFHDYITPDLTVLHSVRERIYSGRTKFQSVDIVRTGSFGLCLVLDGKIQSSEADEFVYHEALVHPAMLAHPQPESVFIAGGGEGATLREVLAHKTVKRAVMVDIDEEVVGLCRRLLPAWHQNAFDDTRAELHFVDARKYLEESRDEFDVIIIDLADPLEEGPARLLYTREFYQTVAQKLGPGGIMSVQSESSEWTNLDNFAAIVNTLRNVFPIAQPYQVHVPSFLGLWGFVSASQTLAPSELSPEEVDARISTRITKQLKSYDGLTHQAMFTIPKHIRQQLASTTRVITDQEPISAY